MAPLTVSVVICCYTEDRLAGIRAAVESVMEQSRSADEIVVVVDHNATLQSILERELAGTTVVANGNGQGLAGARNAGIAATTGEVVAFLDDDAVAAPDWLHHLLRPYRDPNVLGVGGAIEPKWASSRPAWFPEEFDWVIGCSYRGGATGTVRNLIGANMSIRRRVFESAGGFVEGMGRTGLTPLGCEETELCIRARARHPRGRFLIEPAAKVVHEVPAGRARWSYFLSRCYAEGISKANVARLAGAGAGLASERAHALRAIPSGVVGALVDAASGRDRAGLARAGALVAGLAMTAAGLVRGTLTRSRLQPIGLPVVAKGAVADAEPT